MTRVSLATSVDTASLPTSIARCRKSDRFFSDHFKVLDIA